MYKNLIDEAEKDGINQVIVETIIQKESGEILLIEDLKAIKPIYGLPFAELKKEEAVPIRTCSESAKPALKLLKLH